MIKRDYDEEDINKMIIIGVILIIFYLIAITRIKRNDCSNIKEAENGLDNAYYCKMDDILCGCIKNQINVAILQDNYCSILSFVCMVFVVSLGLTLSIIYVYYRYVDFLLPRTLFNSLIKEILTELSVGMIYLLLSGLLSMVRPTCINCGARRYDRLDKNKVELTIMGDLEEVRRKIDYEKLKLFILKYLRVIENFKYNDHPTLNGYFSTKLTPTQKKILLITDEISIQEYMKNITMMNVADFTTDNNREIQKIRKSTSLRKCLAVAFYCQNDLIDYKNKNPLIIEEPINELFLICFAYSYYKLYYVKHN